MKNVFPISFLAVIAILLSACGDMQTSQNAANFGRDKVFPTAGEDRPALTIYLNEYSSAQNRQDREKIFSLTYPKEIELEGGRDGFLEKITAATGDAKSFSYLAGKPTQIILIEGKLLAVIPVLTKQQVAEGWKFSRKVIVGVSEDEGKRWTFADVTNADKRKFLLPEADKLEIPEIKPPWIEK